MSLIQATEQQQLVLRRQVPRPLRLQLLWCAIRARCELQHHDLLPDAVAAARGEEL